MASWRFPRVDVVGVCAPFRGVDGPFLTFLLRWMIVQKGLAFRLDETLKNLEEERNAGRWRACREKYSSVLE
jgi:hypothetical protein